MLPARVAPILFGLILTGVMTIVVAGVATLRTVGPVSGFMWLWFAAWIPSWIVAFPVVLVVAPLTRRFVAGLVKPGA